MTFEQALFEDALILAKRNKVDVFNCLSLMDNEPFLKVISHTMFYTMLYTEFCEQDLKFGPGDGNLNYYLYNWAAPQIEPSELGLVLQ